jgi:acyl carrier protein
MQQKILDFLSKLDTAPAEGSIAVDADLFEGGILDSFGLVDLVTFLEGETGLSISEEDMDDPRFTTVAGIVEVLEGKGAPTGRSIGEPR